ncbi:MAG TPA: DUF2231 domain-containing protein [Kofleriaceae bacterium]|nr:DUF2231 domain-containing protein [Kofleriaceae bacterium]
MKTRAAIAGHPVHPALVAFPVAFYTATVLALIVYKAGGEPFWFRVGLVADIAGVAMGLIAAIPGSVDLFTSVPLESPARATGIQHALFNIAALALFAVSAGVMWSGWHDAIAPGLFGLDATAPLVLSVIGLVCTGVAGVLGWKLVQTHHIGVDDSHRAATPTGKPLPPLGGPSTVVTPPRTQPPRERTWH